MLTQTGGYKNEVSEKMRNEIIVVRAPDTEQDFFSAAEARAEGGRAAGRATQTEVRTAEHASTPEP